MSNQLKLSIAKIPDLLCTPKYAACRLPSSESFLNTDVTGIANFYKFNETDFEYKWDPEISAVTPDQSVESVEEDCVLVEGIAGSVDSFKFVSWVNPVKEASNGRDGWVMTSAFPCNPSFAGDGSAGGDDPDQPIVPTNIPTYPTAAGAPSIRPSFIPMPTAAPRWVGAGGSNPDPSGGGEAEEEEEEEVFMGCGCSVGKVVRMDTVTGKATVRVFGLDGNGAVVLGDEEFEVVII